MAGGQASIVAVITMVAPQARQMITVASGCCKQLPHLPDREDVGDSECLGRLGQGDIFPGLVQYPGIEELQAVEVELDRAPGMCVQEFRKIVEQLAETEVVNPAIEIVADPPDRPGVGVDGLGL